MAVDVQGIILAIIIGTLMAIVYSLRILVMLERRVANMDFNIEKLVEKIHREEMRIELEEKRIEKKLDRQAPKSVKKKK